MNQSIRIALPSKGLLADGSKQLLADVGLPVYNPNPRQYIAWIQALPEVEVIFQRPGDIVTSVRDGSVDFGITEYLDIGWGVTNIASVNLDYECTRCLSV